MREILDRFEIPFVRSHTLLANLKDYKNPRDYIARMVKKGELLRLKNGFFLIASRFRNGKEDYPYEQIANLLYGPSYISLEWALSFYNFIPERVSVVTSVTTGSNKDFKTPIGHFLYRHISQSRYCIDIDHKEIEGQLGGFLVATVEKALADWVFFTCKDLSHDELLRDLIEAKRIEETNLQSLDRKKLGEIAKRYKSKSVNKLYEVIKTL